MRGRFWGAAGRNFTILEVNVVELSLQDKLVLEFRKVLHFCTKAADRQDAWKNGLKWVVVLPPKL